MHDGETRRGLWVRFPVARPMFFPPLGGWCSTGSTRRWWRYRIGPHRRAPRPSARIGGLPLKGLEGERLYGGRVRHPLTRRRAPDEARVGNPPRSPAPRAGPASTALASSLSASWSRFRAVVKLAWTAGRAFIFSGWTANKWESARPGSSAWWGGPGRAQCRQQCSSGKAGEAGEAPRGAGGGARPPRGPPDSANGGELRPSTRSGHGGPALAGLQRAPTLCGGGAPRHGHATACPDRAKGARRLCRAVRSA